MLAVISTNLHVDPLIHETADLEIKANTHFKQLIFKPYIRGRGANMYWPSRIKLQIHFILFLPFFSFQPTKTDSANGDLLVPIVIGVLVAVIVIVVIIFFIVKRRKTSQKYDAEKANGTTDETEKLNDSEKLTENPKA